jgi:hypothetical protein
MRKKREDIAQAICSEFPFLTREERKHLQKLVMASIYEAEEFGYRKGRVEHCQKGCKDCDATLIEGDTE